MQQLPSAAPADLGMSAERLARIPGFFRRYLDQRLLAGYEVLAARGGRVVYRTAQGVKDWDTGEPFGQDSIHRIYSMTKPVTSVALMMLCEEGLIRLEHDVSRYIPAFADLRVFATGDAKAYRTRRPARRMQVRDLLTHTSGLTYGFMHQHAVDRLYRHAGIGGERERGETLEQFVDGLARIPLLFSPGERWNYSVSTDVCGRLVEIVSGQRLDDFFRTRIFEPLGMQDTGFTIDETKLPRLSSCYERLPGGSGLRKQDDAAASSYFGPCSFHSGGGGLLSTASDYFRFCQMLLNGGVLDGARLLSPTTVAFMTRNQLPGNRTLAEMGDSLFSEARADGSGFGLGFSVLIDQIRAMSPVSEGAYSWGGLASTFFWIDPAQELVVVFMTQLMPSSSYPVRSELQTLVYAAIES